MSSYNHNVVKPTEKRPLLPGADKTFLIRYLHKNVLCALPISVSLTH